MKVPGAFDDLGFPIHVDGASIAAPGPVLHRGAFSPQEEVILVCGVGEDAAIVANQIAQRTS